MKYTEKFINKFGRELKVCKENGDVVQQIKGMIQPLRYKNKMYLQGIPTDIGYNNSGNYLLIAPASFNSELTDVNGYLCDGKITYHIDRCEKIYFGDEVFYVWAVLREHKAGDYPVYDHAYTGE